jgi:uncharacterized lipoprotein YehR (DUF1307 family)
MKSRLFIPIVFVLMIILNLNLAICKESREIQKEFTLNKDGRVSIDTYKGSITVKQHPAFSVSQLHLCNR